MPSICEQSVLQQFFPRGTCLTSSHNIAQGEWIQNANFGASNSAATISSHVFRPEKTTGSMVHVRLRFKHPMSGLLAIGAGRYRGFGLLARESSDAD